eukprot:6718625-Prymnesium_polylepis.1
MHIADWYATFCALAGCDSADEAPGVPPPDSINLWPALSARGVPSPRASVALSEMALLRWPYKLVLGKQGGLGYWTGQKQPNGTQLEDDDPGCPDDGCVFHLVDDPTEHKDLAPLMPELRANLTAELRAVVATAWQTGDDCCPGFSRCITQDEYVAAHRGFLGPVCERGDLPEPKGTTPNGFSSAVRVEQGLLRGRCSPVPGVDPTANTSLPEVCFFGAVPFAAPPVGALRWRAPQPPVLWTGERDATSLGPMCLQMNDTASPAVGNESCLFLNVWAPAGCMSAGGCATMLWIHGGGYAIGSGINYDGARDAALAQDVVLVTVNYRLS